MAYPGFQRGGCLRSGPIRPIRKAGGGGGGVLSVSGPIRKAGGGGGGGGTVGFWLDTKRGGGGGAGAYPECAKKLAQCSIFIKTGQLWARARNCPVLMTLKYAWIRHCSAKFFGNHAHSCIHP